MDNPSVQYIVERKLHKKLYNLPKITTHGFRHTHCSQLFEAGTSLKEVQDTGYGSRLYLNGGCSASPIIPNIV